MGRIQPNWADVAGNYEMWYQTPQGRKYDSVEKDLIGRLLSPAQGRRMLDIGCGTGHFTRWLRELGWEVWGVDLEERMLARARELSGEGIIYCQGDAERLPFADRNFYVSAMITTLESTARPEAALGEAIRVSKEMVVLGVLNSLSLLALSRRIRAVFRPTIFSRTRFFSGPVLQSMIRRVLQQLGVPVSVRFASGRKVGRIPLGAFFAMAVELRE